ncbi:hypothetical protein BZM27_31150 [Paraburkholderia steynii]|uniref:DUF6788 domain-containing protein n=1 Tax=Paraburkholderia steynii TaxID=1245441 RepID=A0A4R0X6F7_9BURK|nr:hypothetical protein BZM27_31150 [Paraburkholderia steynii]
MVQALAVQDEASLVGERCLHAFHSVAKLSDRLSKVKLMPRRPELIIEQARERIERIHEALSEIDYLCSGTLLERMKVCGKPGCRCAQDPDARHGPYYEWGHMKGGKLVHRTVSPEQAAVLRRAIANYRQARKLMQAWEDETERLIDAEAPRKS